MVAQAGLLSFSFSISFSRLTLYLIKVRIKLHVWFMCYNHALIDLSTDLSQLTLVW